MQAHVDRGSPFAGGGQPQLQPGVRQFMNGVYGWMSAGLLVTAVVAYLISQSQPMMMAIFGTPLKWLVLFAPLGMAWFLPSRIPTMSSGAAVGVFMAFASILGAGLSTVALVFTASAAGMSILVQALGVTVGVFAGMAVLGYVTKKDLSGMGQFLVMALLGAVIASVINMFIASEGMGMIVSIIVAIAAAGLTAYHTQAVKQMYLMNGGRGNLAILGALLLYVDFVNLFLSLLHLFSGSRD